MLVYSVGVLAMTSSNGRLVHAVMVVYLIVKEGICGIGQSPMWYSCSARALSLSLLHHQVPPPVYAAHSFVVISRFSLHPGHIAGF